MFTSYLLHKLYICVVAHTSLFLFCTLVHAKLSPTDEMKFYCVMDRLIKLTIDDSLTNGRY